MGTKKHFASYPWGRTDFALLDGLPRPFRRLAAIPYRWSLCSMSEIEILVLGRAIERVLIVLICGASLGFGWNLFREGVVEDQEAEVSRGQWKLTLKKVGPGVFFALFACIGLVYAVTSPLTLGPRTATKGDHTALGAATITASYNAPTVDKLARDEIKAINTLTILWRSDRLPNAPKTELEAGDQAAQMLLERKDRLLRAIFPQDYDRYKDIKGKAAYHPDVFNTLTPEEKAQYDRVEHLNNDSLMTSPAH
ncbi:MAG: hypothetical protein ACJ72H_00090 [Candidatus Sulfotelmatobacter sp.]